MKNFILLFLLLSIVFFNCKNASKASEKKELTSEISNNSSNQKTESTTIVSTSTTDTSKVTEEKILSPSEDEGIDFWTSNDCTLGIPEPVISEENNVKNYITKLNKRQGYLKEELTLENGYRLTVTQKGCGSYSLVFSYFFRKNNFDINDQNAISKKILELMEMTGKICKAPYNFKTRIPALRQAVEQIGPFQLGEEMVLSSDEIGESFMLEYLQERNGKIFLSYYFSMGPM